MTRTKSVFIILGLAMLLIWSFGCNDGTPINSQNSPLLYTSKALMKAATATSTYSGLNDIPVVGGTVNIQTALINIADLIIEENSGENDEQIDGDDDQDDNDQDGDFQDGDQDDDQDEENEDEEGDSNNVDNEDEQDGDFEYGEQDSTDDADIFAAGPFALDISSGQALIGTFDIYAGTFRQIDFSYTPIEGKSITIGGEFTATAGSPVSFTLESAFAEQVQMLLSNGGITVAGDSTVELTVVFDLAEWLADVDFSGAQLTNGQILINGNNNPELLLVFEAKLAQYVEVEDGKNDD